MNQPNRHIIQKLVFDLQGQDVPDGFEFQQEVGRVAREKLTAALGELFDRFAGPDELIALEELRVEIEAIPQRDFADVLVDRVLEALEIQLSRQIQFPANQTGIPRQPWQQSLFAHWLAFLETGHLSWKTPDITETEWQATILAQLASETKAIRQLSDLLRQSAQARLRLIRQYQEVFLAQLVGTFTASRQSDLLLLRAELQAISTSPDGPMPGTSDRVFVELFWQEALRHFVIKRPPLPRFIFLEKLAQTIFPQKADAPLGHFLTKLRTTAIAHSSRFPTILEILRTGPDAGTPAQLQLQDARTGVPQSNQAEGKPLAQTSPEAVSPAASDDKNHQAPIPPDAPDATREAGEMREAQFDADIPTPDSGKPATLKTTALEKDELSTALPASERPGELLDKTPSNDHVPEISSDLPIGLPPPNEIDRPGMKEAPMPNLAVLPEGTAFYVRNAGVVLLHPFLPAFFREFDLLDGSDFRDEIARHRAAHLIQYLATGATMLPEYELLLPKFLCNIPFGVPLERFVELTEQEKNEGENLLKAAVRNWPVLQNTSPDGLREGFLQREGKLEKRPAGWFLVVEQRGIDMLLDRLPWNLSMIKLPWMTELLRVEWG